MIKISVLVALAIGGIAGCGAKTSCSDTRTCDLQIDAAAPEKDASDSSAHLGEDAAIEADAFEAAAVTLDAVNSTDVPFVADAAQDGGAVVGADADAREAEAINPSCASRPANPETDPDCYPSEFDYICQLPDGTSWAIYGSTGQAKHYRSGDGGIETLCETGSDV